MRFRTITILLVALLVGGASIGLWTIGLPLARALSPTPCADQVGNDAFMGMSGPGSPYDLRFIDEMVMHHQGAIMSAEAMIGDSERPELRDLARRIQQGQQRQIDQMREWRAEWYPEASATPQSMTPMMDGGMMGGGMMGAMMGGADQMFLQMMIPHHQLAIDMAEDALVRSDHDELKQLAREIIADQSAEITEMEGYLLDWYGAESTRDTADDMLAMMRTMAGDC